MANDEEFEWAPITATHWCECLSKWIDDSIDTDKPCCTPVPHYPKIVEHTKDFSVLLVEIAESVKCPDVGYSYMCGFNDAKKKVIDVLRKSENKLVGS